MKGRFHVSRRQQKAYWDQQIARRDPAHPAVQACAQSKVRWLTVHLRSQPSRILEVGCGNGYFSTTLQRIAPTTCVDFSFPLLARNPASSRRKVQALAETLPFPDGSFDLVLCANLLHHLESPGAAVAEMARVSSGSVAIFEPNARNPLVFAFSILKKEERGAAKFSRGFVRSLGEKAGLVASASACQGVVMPNRTPAALVPLLAPLERTYPLGLYTLTLFEKRG